MKCCTGGGIMRSSVVIRYQLGFCLHAGSWMVSESALTPHGTCESAMNAALSVSTSPANDAANFVLSRDRYPSDGGRIGGAGASAGAAWMRSLTDSPSSGANAQMYTSSETLGSLPAPVITAPPYEWPTSVTGPSCAPITRLVAATSSESVSVGFCTMLML